jgi:Secretion system C-terminal sorting domain
MKKIFTLFLFTGLFQSAIAQWVPLGAKGFSNVAIDASDMAVSTNGLPTVAYISSNTKKATVMQFTTSGGNMWDTLANAEMSTINTSAVNIKADTANNFWVATINSVSKAITVKKLNGASWAPVGAANFSGSIDNTLGSTVTDYWDFAVSTTGTPYVLFFDDGTQRPHVMKFNGTAWANVGSLPVPNVGFMDGGANIELDNTGSPIISYSDSMGYKITVQKFNGTSWVAFPKPIYNADIMTYSRMKLNAAGQPLIVFNDFANSNFATLKKSNGSNWSNVGAAGFSAASFWDISLAIDNADNPIVAFPDASAGGKATVLKYSGGTWAPISGATGFTISGLNSPVVTTDPQNNPYLSFQDWDISNFASVFKLFNNPLSLYNLTLSGSASEGTNTITCILENNITDGNLDLEKSIDGQNFTAINTTKISIDILNKKFAQFADNKNLAAMNYYRAKYTSNAGVVSYSNTIAMKAINNTSISVYPNPAQDFINIKSDVSGNADVLNAAGQVVYSTTLSSKGITVLNLQTLPNGFYQIKIDGVENAQTFLKK